MTYEPALTAQPGTTPPRVEIQFVTLDPAAVTINVERTQEGRTYKVRGGVAKPVAGGASLVDSEAGFGVPLTYRAEMFDASGNSLGYTDSTVAQLDVTDTWIHQPLNPSLAIKGRIFNTTANAMQRATNGSFVIPEGASVGSWIGSQFQGLTNMPLQFQVSSPTDGDTFLSMFGSYTSDYPAIICIRTPPPVRHPRTLFFSPTGSGSTDGPVENAQANWSLLVYSFTGNEAAPPTPALVVPLLTRADLDASFPTRSAMDSSYNSRLSMDTDYSKAGTAEALGT